MRENTRLCTCHFLRHAKALYSHLQDETEVIVEDLLMPSKNVQQQLFMSFKFPQGRLNSRNDGLDQLEHIHGDKGDLLDPDLL